MSQPTAIRSAEVVLPCTDLDATLAFFVDRLGFRVDAIAPADGPRQAVISGHGLRIRLQRGGAGSPGHLRLACDDPGQFGDTSLVAPNGTRIELVAADPPLHVPPLRPSFIVTRAGGEWGTGRAGMRYRDLIPDRQGGRFIGSTIAIRDGGPVPDYVHFHVVRFQLIYCRKGWVKVVYEDQGPAFDMLEGDCVLQPPGIRHRVLDSSPGLEVVEITCPAEHDTFADHDITLPTTTLRPERDFGGQRFVRHQAASATWGRWRHAGFAARETEIGAATGGLAGVRVIRSEGATHTPAGAHGGELQFWFVLAGAAVLAAEGRDQESLAAGDSVVIPGGVQHSLQQCTHDLEWLEVTLPERLPAASSV